MSTVALIAVMSLAATPVAALFILGRLLMFRKEEPMRPGVMEIQCYICDKRIFVLDRDPHPGILAHLDTEEHKRNMEEKDA